MELQFVGKDPESDSNNCPSVLVDKETGDFLLCGWTVTDLETLATIAAHAGDGTYLDDEVTDDPEIVRTCAVAFEAVWELAIPHADYRPA
jgi:hypothetical protein